MKTPFMDGPLQKTEVWSGLSGSAMTFELLRRYSRPTEPLVLVCPTDEQAQHIFEREAKFFHRILGLRAKLAFYPSRDTDFSPSTYLSEETTDRRLSCLRLCSIKEPFILITSVKALGQKTIPRDIFQKHSHMLMLHDDVPRDTLIKDLIASGYERESITRAPGTFSARGDIVDFFSVHQDRPVRLEFFGDRIERMTYFLPEEQTSIPGPVLEFAEWVPSNEILLSSIDKSAAIRRLKALSDDLDLPPQSRLGLEDAIRDERRLPAMDHLFPIFYEKAETILDHLPKNSTWIGFDPLQMKTEIQNVDFEFQKYNPRKERLQSHPSDFMIPLDRIEAHVLQTFRVFLSPVDIHLPEAKTTKSFVGIETHEGLQSELIRNKKSQKPFDPLATRLSDWIDRGFSIYLVASTSNQLSRIQQILVPYLPRSQFVVSQELVETKQDPTNIYLVEGDLYPGFVSPEHRTVFLTETDIFGEQKSKAFQAITQENVLDTLQDLQTGDPVVHIDHGIGLYHGLHRIKVGSTEGDFLVIQYQDQDKLFLPVYRLNRIHKYISADGKKAKIDRLGSQNWEQAKKKAKKAVEEMAQELIELYAKRKVAKGYSYSEPDESYVTFEAEFPFEETRDQIKTIEEIFSDLESDKPMDRLVCGDVGFGKTEVALRAAYRVASEGKQVAVLVPTTILCQQHFQTFKKRFQHFPIDVDFLSRFKTSAEAKETVQKLKDGYVDIVVGTHRLLSKDVEFSNLGLLILDEEHRFGVKHKEHIKKFRNKIDVLTLTATPIPRTLQLSMTGIRDLSVINTPPINRKSVHTILCNFNDETIRNVVQKEVSRNGQIFFLHNRVESIYTMKTYLSKILPEVRIQVAHGQMNQEELEKTMLGFLNHEFDLLLCTTIIESGLDIPNANTLIVNRADTFGLSQLYQIRGRVGRSHKEAFAYFMVPDRERMTKDAVKRLRALKQFTELGSGLKISLHDMEIRGAGNLLGAKQSGQISNVGFELYSQLLEREIRRLKGEKVQEEIEPEIQVNTAAFIPDDYIDEQSERLRFYKRLSACKTDEEMNNIRNELKDRFGPFPQTVDNLFEVVGLKIVARECGVISLKIQGFSPVIEFSDQAPIDIDRLLAMARKDSSVRLTPDQKLILNFESDLDPLEEAKKVLRGLQARGKN